MDGTGMEALRSARASGAQSHGGASALSGYEIFKAGREHSNNANILLPFWDDEPPLRRPASARQAAWRPAPKQPRARQLLAPPPPTPPLPPSRAASTVSSARRRFPTEVEDVPLAAGLASQRLTMQFKAEQKASEDEFHVNSWLEARGKLPRHRTISKARRAALAGCYRLLDPSEAGSEVGVEPSDVQLILRALSLPPHVISAVLGRAQLDDSGLFPPHEFTRVCVEAEQRAKTPIAAFASPRLASETFPLALAMERHRIHGLISGHVARLEGANTRARSPTAPVAPVGGVRGGGPPRGGRRGPRRTPQETLRRVTEGRFH